MRRRPSWLTVPWVGQQALAAVIGAATLAVVAALAGGLLLVGSDVFQWLGEDISLERWQLIVYVVSAFTVAPAIFLVLLGVNGRRQRKPELVVISSTASRVDIAGVGPSSAVIKVKVTDKEGRPVANNKIDLYTPKGRFPNSLPIISLWSDRNGVVESYLDVTFATPGDAVISAMVHCEDVPSIFKLLTVNIVGPPAFITLTVSPSLVIVGEPITVVAKVTDAIGQNVWDGHSVKLSTNAGTFHDPEPPTANGIAIAYLLTNALGAATVVAASQSGLSSITSQAIVTITPPLPTPAQA